MCKWKHIRQSLLVNALGRAGHRDRDDIHVGARMLLDLCVLSVSELPSQLRIAIHHHPDHHRIAILLIPQRNPINLAKALSSLDVLSNGRLIVGVGLGASTRHYPAYGLAPEGRVARFRENLDIMKRLWTEDKVTLSGRFSHLDRIPMEPKPVQKPHPPIWFGGHAEAALRRAVELGDGYIGAGSTPMRAFLEDIKQLPTDFPKAKRLYLALGDNLPRLRDWFGAFYGKPEMADQVRSGDHHNRLQTRSGALKTLA